MDEITHRLQAYYQRKLPISTGVKVGELETLPGGWESDLYAFRLEHGAAATRTSERLVLQLYSGYDARQKAAHEFATLQRLEQLGYPVPRVHLVEIGESPFGRPFVVMERIDGPVMRHLLLHGSETAQAALMNTFCELFARLHALDWRRFPGESAAAAYKDPYIFVDRSLEQTYTDIERYSLEIFLPILGWLEDHREALACPGPALVHGDFHPGNILFRQQNSPVVIDWTGSGVSDARFDLAWTLLLADAYLGSPWRERILFTYQESAGQETADLDQFEVFACLRRLLDIIISLSRGAEQRGMRREAGAAIRADKQAHARVYQLLVDRTGIAVKEVEKLIAAL